MSTEILLKENRRNFHQITLHLAHKKPLVSETGQEDKTEWALFHLKETEIACEMNRRSTWKTAERTCWCWESMAAFQKLGMWLDRAWWILLINIYLTQRCRPWLILFFLIICSILWVKHYFQKYPWRKNPLLCDGFTHAVT